MVAVVTLQAAIGVFRVQTRVSAGIEQPPPTGRVRVVVGGAAGSTLVHVPMVTTGGGGGSA